LHALKRGDPVLFPSLEAESSSLGDSSRMALNNGDLLRVMPPNTAPRLAAFGWPIQVVKAVGRHLEWAWC
jgi:hypothetical protein